MLRSCLYTMMLVCVGSVTAYGAAFDVVADFDSAGQVAAWWGGDSVAPYVYATDLANTDHVHSGNAAIKVTYDKANDPNTYSFLSASGYFNFHNFDYLSFWVYNNGSALKFRIRLEDEDMNAWESNWSDIEPAMKTGSADWENLVVDLTRTFYGHSNGDIDMNRIRHIMFYVQPGEATGSGEFWMDDILLHRSPNGTPIEVFESDNYGWSAGAPFSLSLTNTAFHNDDSARGLGQQAMKVTWTTKGSGDEYSNFIYTPRHDTNSAPEGRIGNFSDFTNCSQTHLEMWILSTTDNNIPILLKLDDQDVETQTYTGNGSWQKLSYDYSTNDASDVETVWIFPYPGENDNGGTLYIDDVTLTGSSNPQIPLGPTNVQAAASDPDEDGSYSLSWSAVPNVTDYEVQEDTDPDFGSPVSMTTNATTLAVSHDPVTEEAVYYYRVRSRVSTNRGSFAAPLSVEVKDFPDPMAKYEAVADFDGNGLFTTWWGGDPQEPYVYQQDFMSMEHVHNGDYAMKVNYDKSLEVRTNQYEEAYTNAYSFFALSGEFNLLNFDYFSFWVYNDGSPLRIKLRFEELGNSERAWETDWAGIFPEMQTTQADWENIAVDLTRAFYGHFNGDIDMRRVGQIMFMIDPGDETATGEFWLDDIRLNRSVNCAPLEPFESDFYGWAAGSPFVITTSYESAHNDGTGVGQRSLKVSWSSKQKNYSNITYQPEHDTANAPLGRIGNYGDFELLSNDVVELYIRSDTESEMPLLLKFDDLDVGFRTYRGAGEWQRMVWDYSSIAGAHSVTQVFVIPYPDQADEDGGTLYLDDLNLLNGAAAEIPWAPSWGTTARFPDGDGQYTVYWDEVPGAIRYDLQESTDNTFSAPTTLSTNGLSVDYNRDPVANEGTVYYRMRSVSATQTGNWTAARSVTLEYRPEAQLEYETLETFDGTGLIANWWANDPSSPFVYVMDFGSTQHVHSGTIALQVDYDKANDPNVYSFFSASGLFNLQNYDYFSFWVYNDGSPLSFRIRLEDDEGLAFESNWAGITPEMKTPEADWENLVVDLTRTFNAELDMSAIKQIMFIADPTTNGTESGTFWLDDVEMHRAVNSAPLESFESDFYGWAAGAPFVLTNSAEACHNDGSNTALGQHAMKVTWGPKGKNYSNFTYQPDHDSGNAPLGRIGNYSDFTLNSNYIVECWFMSPTETNVPVLLKLDHADVGMQYVQGTGTWQRLTWDYSSLPNAHSVTQVFVIPYPNQSDDGGVMYFDDLNLAGGSPPALPIVPEGLDATYPNASNEYTVSWLAADGMAGYELQEATDANFNSAVNYEVAGTNWTVSKNSYTEGGTYYYRVRSYLMEGETKVYGAFSPYVPVYVPILSLEEGSIHNLSYDTLCAEVDNINIPFMHTNVESYRVTVTHPDYYPTTINERGADFDDCSFTHRATWELGTNDGSSAEFKTSGYSNGDLYYAPDHPHAGIDEDDSELPYEINNNTMYQQDIIFTADEDEDVNLEVRIGSRFEIDMAEVSGVLELKVYTWDGTNWTDQGSQVFDSGTTFGGWDIPDFTWQEGTDSNTVRLAVVRAGDSVYTTTNAYARYDHILMRKRDEAGETEYPAIYDDGNVIVVPIHMDFWWRAPESMTVTAVGGTTATNVHYFRIIKRVPDTNFVSYSQVFVLYEDGNSRILPSPPDAVDWTPFGSSVILGPTEDIDRPFVGIDEVIIDPSELSMDLLYDEGGSCHVELWVDKDKHVVDVTDIQYNTTNKAFARFRSMWVMDGKADIDRATCHLGTYPIMQQWEYLPGPWWRLHKEIQTYHNTYCPDFRVEITGPSKAFLIRQAETYDWATNCAWAIRSNGRGGEAINMSVDGGEAVYNIHVDKTRPNTYMHIRYSDDDGGNNGDYPGNLVEVYLDGELKDSTHTMNTDGWNDFETLPGLYLGHLLPGDHEIRIVSGGLTFGLDVDEFQLISHPDTMQVEESLLTRQAETLDSGSNYVLAARDTAEGGLAVAMSGDLGGYAYYDFNLAEDLTNVYMRIRYSDDVGPTKMDVFMDGVRCARWPTEDTGYWDDYDYSRRMYLGDLEAGGHQMIIVSSNETWGVDVDSFEMFTIHAANRAPQITVPDPQILPVGSSTNFQVIAYDLDGEDVMLTNGPAPAGAVWDNPSCAWAAVAADENTTNTFVFIVDDLQGADNSVTTNSALVMVPRDYDGNGLGDGWEYDQFGGTGADPEADPDGDGADNYYEYIAGTAPDSASSVFSAAFDPATVATQCCIQISTQPGRLYTIYWRDTLTSGVWSGFNNTGDGVGTWFEGGASSSTFTFVDDFSASTSGGAPADGTRYYRIEVEYP